MVDEEFSKQRAKAVDNSYEDFNVHLRVFCGQSGTQDYVFGFMGDNPGASTDDIWTFQE